MSSPSDVELIYWVPFTDCAVTLNWLAATKGLICSLLCLTRIKQHRLANVHAHPGQRKDNHHRWLFGNWQRTLVTNNNCWWLLEDFALQHFLVLHDLALISSTFCAQAVGCHQCSGRYFRMFSRRSQLRTPTSSCCLPMSGHPATDTKKVQEMISKNLNFYSYKMFLLSYF